MRLDGTLAGPAAGTPRDVAWRFARSHAAVLGLSDADFASFGAAKVRAAASGITTVRWRQSFQGVPAFDNGLRVNLGRGNRVLSVGGSPVPGLRVASVTPALSATGALRSLMDSVGSRRNAEVVAQSPGPQRATRFSTGDRAHLVLFHGRGTRLAWSITYRASSTAWYAAVVDAVSGAVLRRANLVDHAAPVTVFEHYPGAPLGGTQQPRDLETLGYVDPGATRLTGPFARTYLDVNDTNEADPGEEVVPGSYPFEDFTATVGADGFCAPAKQCAWDPEVRASWQANREEAAVQAHYYVSRFHDHLSDSAVAFSAADGDFAGIDRVEVNADDGADTQGDGGPDLFHVDNANMATPPDGEPPLMQMYLFEPLPDFGAPFRAMNGSDDAVIVYHEYTHGLSNRLVVDADGASGLNGFQSGAMGEAWSDWYAKDFLARQGLELDDPATDGEVYMGEYSDGERGLIRTEALDCKVGADPADCPGGIDITGDGEPETGPGGYTFGDMTAILGFPEVHADGEIWGQTLWELRQRLVVREGSETAGSDLAEELVTDGMRLSPPEPSFLDMRNAILQADVGANGGVNRDLLWSVFATRGMGYFAGALDANDFGPQEDFAMPPGPGAPTGTIAGKLTDADSGLPVAGQKVGVGGHATDPSFVDALVTTSHADGTFALSVPAGTYRNVTITGGGFNTVQADDVVVPAGGTKRLDATIRRDWAAPASGASLESNDDSFAYIGCGSDKLVDQSSASGWSAYQADAEPPPDFLPPNPHPGELPFATIELARPIDIKEFLMDPGPTCGDDPTSMTRRYRVETSQDGATFKVAKEGSFHTSDANRLNTVEPDANAARVRFVRLTLLESFKPYSSGSLFIDFSELEILGTPPNALPTGSLTASPNRAAPNQAVTLSASFTDADSRIVGYDWDFDRNGTVDQTTVGASATTSYATAGTYTPKVFAKDFRGGAGVAETTVDVAQAPPGGQQPPPGGEQSPVVTLSRRGSNGRVRFTVACDSACAGRARLVVSGNDAKRLKLRGTRLSGSTRFAMITAGTRRFSVRVSARVRRAMRRARVRRITTRLTVTVTDAERQTRTAKTTARIRR
jgi:Zn-dependent metalloprotease